MRGVLDAVGILEALWETGIETPLDNVKRIVVFIVNSVSAPPTDWERTEAPPGTLPTLIKAAGTPIDVNSFESVEQLKDIAEYWRTMRLIKNSPAMSENKDPAVARSLHVPDAEIYAVNISFASLKDKAEFGYLNSLPTSFVLPPEAVDRLRAAARTIINNDPEFLRLMKDLDSKVVTAPPNAP